jgi:GT2 family glycosyltransferase
MTPASSRLTAADPSISVSIVVYRPDLEELGETLRSLRVAAEHALSARRATALSVDLIDNGTEHEDALDSLAADAFAGDDRLTTAVLRGHGNVGYGRGHNLSLLASTARYHLVLNPDVLMAPEALAQAVAFMERHHDVGLLAPQTFDGEGTRQYLCRDYPTVFLLFLRGFAPRPLRRAFGRYMEAHELRARTSAGVARGIPLISGSFMFGRRSVLQHVRGFSPAYFMYFEDSELSLAVGRVAVVAYVPDVRIVHFGGGAARKGWRHTRLFVRSAFTFFRRNGWRWV